MGSYSGSGVSRYIYLCYDRTAEEGGAGMTDYCMCYGEGCKDKEICYRYRAKPTPGWQSYFKEQPGKDRNCGQFLRN